MNYLNINKALWNARTKVHVESKFYDVQGFLEGNSPLNQIELDLLGDIKGKKVLHLQCHFGLDTLALARLGADVTGVDFSDEAIAQANKLAYKSKTKAEFICCDIYQLSTYLSGEFDLIFTSYGTIGWLPDINQWAEIIHRFLTPQGTFVFAEFHPVVWMFDDNFKEVQYSYFNVKEIIEETDETYTDGNIETLKSVSWNHTLSDVLQALIHTGLDLKEFKEFNYSPYDCFHGTKKIGDKKYIIEKFGDKMPLVYALRASKPSLRG